MPHWNSSPMKVNGHYHFQTHLQLQFLKGANEHYLKLKQDNVQQRESHYISDITDQPVQRHVLLDTL